MPIQGMTGEYRWPRLGSIRKGEAKPNEKQPGKDLGDELRFVGVDDEVTDDWIATFGGTKVDEILVRLPFPTVDENWQAWMESYVAGGLVHRCDRRTVVLQLMPDGTYDDTPRRCDGRCGAKPVGRLDVFVPAFQRMGTVMVNTTSIHDIMNLDGCLRSLAMLVGDLTKVQFTLKRVQREISTPGSNGKRARRPVWLLHLEPAPDWVRAITAGGQALAELTGPETLALPGPSAHPELVDGATGEIIEGEASAVQNGFRQRVEACTTLDELRGLWTDVQAIDEAAYKANVIALWRTQAVAIIRHMIPDAGVDSRGDLAHKLEQLPATTPGRDDALREIEELNWNATTEGDEQHQEALLVEAVPA